MQSIQKVQYGFKELHGIAVDNNDYIYLTDKGSGKLFKFSRNYELVKELDAENINAWGIVVVKEKVIVGSRDDLVCLHVLDQKEGYLSYVL